MKERVIASRIRVQFAAMLRAGAVRVQVQHSRGEPRGQDAPSRHEEGGGFSEICRACIGS